MKKPEASLFQLNWTVDQAAFLKGWSHSKILSKIYSKWLNEEEGHILVDRPLGSKKPTYSITRKGMTRLTGYKFPEFDYLELAEAIIRISENRMMDEFKELIKEEIEKVILKLREAA